MTSVSCELFTLIKFPLLLPAARRGERPAQHALYEAFAAQVFGVCLRYASSRAEADDWAQDTWVAAFGKLDQYNGEGPFGAWLRRVAVTTCLMALRRQRRFVIDAVAAEQLGRDESPLPAGLQVDPSVLASLNAEELIGYIQALPEGFRAVFNLVAIEGYSHAEAAELLGISAGTSRSQLTRARAALQARLHKMLTICL